MRIDGNVFRVLEEQDERVLVIDCQKKAMPFYRMRSEISAGECVPEAFLSPVRSMEELSPKEREIALKRYSMIAAALMVLSDTQKRQAMISDAAVRYDVSKQTLRSYLCQYLVYQEIAALAPKKKEKDTELSGDQKNMRWALKGIITGLKNKITEPEQKLSSRDSICEQMERGRLKSENDSLRKENQKLRDVLAAHGIPFGRKQVDRDSR